MEKNVNLKPNPEKYEKTLKLRNDIEKLISEFIPHFTDSQKQKIERLLTGVPVIYRIPYLKSIGGQGRLGAAVKQNCLMCVGYERAEVNNCTGYECPLYNFRPKFAE